MNTKDSIDWEHVARAEKAEAEVERLTELADKYKWQVIDTCKRAEKAERERDALREALTIANDDAQKLALRLEGESNFVAELSRRLAALEAKP